MLKRLKIYWIVWQTTAKYALAELLVSRWSSLIFFVGKGARFAMTLLFLLLLKQSLAGIGGYTTDQVVVFFLTYQLTDNITQMFFRGVYTFSWEVRSGELDFYLSKPLNPLFRILTGKPDFIDASFFIPTTIFSIWLISTLHLHITSVSLITYFFLLMNTFLIAAAFHIFVICIGILTTEVDNVIMLYRDATALSRFPIDVYREPLRTILFFIVPVGLMNTLPAQFLLNLKPTTTVLLSFAIGGGFFLLSLWTWRLSLRKYTSAGG